MDNKSFSELMCQELEELISGAYGRDDLTAYHLKYETWAVTLRKMDEPRTLVACSTLSFYPDFPSHFQTAFEAVDPNLQRTGLGRLLYECIAVWTRFLLLNDELVADGVVQSQGDYCIVSFIDAPERINTVAEDFQPTLDDNEQGHGAFLKKIGFIRAQQHFGQNDVTEIAFQRDFHVPLLEGALVP